MSTRARPGPSRLSRSLEHCITLCRKTVSAYLEPAEARENTFGQTLLSAIAAMHNTNLAVVAPGIAEALFATAIGLVAAIPAVLAYNQISNSLSRFAGRLDNFGSEFSAILSRQSEERS